MVNTSNGANEPDEKRNPDGSGKPIEPNPSASGNGNGSASGNGKRPNVKRVSNRRSATSASGTGEKGTPTQANNEGAQETILDVETPKARTSKTRDRGEPPKEAPAPAARAKAKKQSDGEILANTCAGILEHVSSYAMKMDTKFTPDEKEFILPPLTRIIDRIDLDSVQKANAITDPLLLIAGLVFWYMRLKAMQPQKVKAPAQTPTNITQFSSEPAPNINGNVSAETAALFS